MTYTPYDHTYITYSTALPLPSAVAVHTTCFEQKVKVMGLKAANAYVYSVWCMVYVVIVLYVCLSRRSRSWG